MRIAITGASGFIGVALVAHLADRHDLILLGRDPQRLAAQFGHRFPTFHNTEALGAFADVDVVVHLAAALPGTLASEAEYQEANTTLTMNMGEAAAAAHVQIFINATTLGWNRNAYSRTKLAAEDGLNYVPGLRVAHIRLPAVYSNNFSGRLSILNSFPEFLRLPLFQCLGSLRPTASMEHVVFSIDNLIELRQKGNYIVSDRQMNNKIYLNLKLFVDYTFSLGVILFFWWLFIFIFFAIRLDSNGPPVFVQKRVGKDRKIFECFKFRTMHIGTANAATHQISEDAITRVGRLLRRTKLDELPQVMNILKRDMSLVGPRPCLPVQKELVEARDELGVYEVLPGLTGLSQVDGIDMSSPRRLARSDEYYVATRNLLTDLMIILRTIAPRKREDRV
ncbi:hybrid nucleoside-diphosphate sugar epimerase/sugar transferase [Ahrensia marina]|uniref:sugar transferase n=1 Tax=Ahrensia marina TaxID=1514904 RepID=UPI0035D11655